MRDQTSIGGYRLIKRIGAGGMSTVFEAEDGAGQRVAFKLFHPGLLAEDSGRQRLRREVAMLQKVRGPFVAEVIDAEAEEDEAFIVTELIDGPTLDQDVADSGVYTGQDLADLAERLGQAVESIHRAGVLHRDLKPSNVMIGPQGPVLIDFGIAQLGDDSRLTVPGSLAHTPGYCDPAVIQGADPSENADWWSLAAVVAFAATGRPPFGGGPPPAIMRRVLDDVPDLDGLDRPTAAALARALHSDPARRIGFGQLVEALASGTFEDPFGEEPSAASAPRGKHGIATAGLTGAALAGGALADCAAADGANGAGATEILPGGALAAGESHGPGFANGPTEVLDATGMPGGGTETFDSRQAYDPPPTEALGDYGGDDYGRSGATEVLPAGVSGYPASPGGATEVLGGDAYALPEGGTQVLPSGPPEAASFGATEVLPPSVPPRRAEPAVAPPGSSSGQNAYPARWGEHFGGPVQSAETQVPEWLRPAPPARLLVALSGMVFCALAVRLPVVALQIYAFVAVLLAVFGASREDLNNRRATRGGRYQGEGLGVAVRLPWVVVKSVIAQVVCIGLGAAFGAAAVWGVTYVSPQQPLLATLAGGAVTFVLAWTMVPNRSAQVGARDLFAAIAPSGSYRAFWALILCGVVAVTALYSTAVYSPDWTPFPEVPIFARII